MKLTIPTQQHKQIIDITDQLEEVFGQNGLKEGICHLFTLHTTAALTIADLDPGTDLDMLDAFEAMIPKLRYRHPHNPAHVGDHIMSAMIGPGLGVPVERGKLVLGPWQRVVLVELDGPRERGIIIQALASSI